MAATIITMFVCLDWVAQELVDGLILDGRRH